jgi:hypothetical protein
VKDRAVILLTDGERVLDGVQDVFIGDPVPAGGPVDLHVPNIVSRNSTAAGSRHSGAPPTAA